jgi:nicotinamide-nucleotide amidase
VPINQSHYKTIIIHNNKVEPMNSISKTIFQKLSDFLKRANQYIENKSSTELVSDKNQSIEVIVGGRLLKKNATIALAESCTGGLLAHRLTNLPGSSDYFLFSGVTYSNESKRKVLGVLPSTIEKYGAVHEETAKEMAKGAMRIAKAAYGLSTTGIAGPSGGTKEKPVGTVCIGLATESTIMGHRLYFPAMNRVQNKEAFATAALKLLLNELEKD